MDTTHITRVPGPWRCADRFEVSDQGERYAAPPGYRITPDDIMSPKGHRGYITEHKGRLQVCTLTGGEKPARLVKAEGEAA